MTSAFTLAPATALNRSRSSGTETCCANLALDSGEWFFLLAIVDRLFHHAIHLKQWSDFPRPPLAFEAVGRFELAFRNVISEALSSRFGSHPYYDRTAFKDAKAHNQALCQVIQTFDK